MSRRLIRIASCASFVSSFFILAFILTPATFVNAAKYDNGRMDFAVGIESVVTVTLPKQNVSFLVDSTSSNVSTGSFDIGIYTNRPYGVTVSMATAYEKQSNNDNKANGLNSIRNNTIYALEQEVQASQFPNNRWGYSIDGGYHYLPMPSADSTELAEIKVKNPEDSGIKNIIIGAKANENQPTDYYYSTINFFATANVAAKTIDEIYYMQEMEGSVAESMVINRDYRLRDIRDNTVYLVTKFEDGNVWMTQNLDLALSPDKALTPEDTDLKRDWTPRATPLVSDSNKKPNSKDADYNISSSNVTYHYYDAENERTASLSMYGRNYSSCVAIHQNDPEVCDHFNPGHTYQAQEVFALNYVIDQYEFSEYAGIEPGLQSTVNESICPKGWRLPKIDFNIGTYSEAGKSDFPVPVGGAVNIQDSEGRSIITYNKNAILAYAPHYFLSTLDNPSSSTSGYTTNVRGSYITSTLSDSGEIVSYRVVDQTFGTNGTNGRNYNTNKASYYVRCLARASNQFEISYDLNGGNGVTPSPQFGESWQDSYTFKIRDAKIPYKEGYNFIGWATKPDASAPDAVPLNLPNGSSTAFYNERGELLTKGYYQATQPSTKLYAVWEEAIIVGFNANGGVFGDDNPSEGETAERRFIAFSPKYDSETTYNYKNFSSVDVDGNKKESINDNKKPFAKNTVTANSITLPPKTTATVTLQYATPQDSFLCITKGSYSLYSLRDYNCNDSNANPYGGNLSNNAYYYASDTPVYKRTITLTNNTSSDGYYTLVFRTTDTNGDSRKNWYGFWATVEYKTILSGDRQYRRSSRYSPGIPTRRGYAFAGWSTDPEETVEGAILDSSSTLSDSWRQYCNDTNDYSRCDASIELYALWKKIDAVPVRFVTNNPERVNLATTEIEWNASVSGLNLRVENNAIQYYVSSNGEYVTIGTFSYSSTTNSFLKVGLEFLPSQYISQSNTLALQEGEYLTVNINYSEAEVTTMQELDRMSCSAAPVGTSAQLIDSRDGKKYWITKLNDGNCWMTQNLDIALSTSGTTVDSHTIYTEATWNRSQNSQVNNYYDGGDYYMQNGMTAVSTEGLADDAEEWHYHRGSIYNAHVAVYLCPPNWELGNYQMLFKSYGINQPDAYAYSFRDQTLFNAPIYITADIDGSVSRADVEASGSSSAGDSSVFWSSAYVQPNLTTPMSSYVYAPFSYNYNATTGLFTGVSNYQYAPRQGGFVRCMR